MFPVKNEEQYLEYCLKSFEGEVDGIYAVDNGSTDNTKSILRDYNVNFITSRIKGDMGRLLNKILFRMPTDGWVFRTDADQVLFDLFLENVAKDKWEFYPKQKRHLRRYAGFLEDNNIFCSDVRNIEICYNYGTMLGIDWGDGPGILWTARRLFKYTGAERFVEKWHENISNIRPNQSGESVKTNYEHTGKWDGPVVKTHEITLFHYGKCKGIERWRDTKHRAVVDVEAGVRGLLPTIPYRGPHPKVMKI